MKHQHSHPSRQELLLAADGELSGRRASQVLEHLKACWECRTRLHEIESAIAGFVNAEHDYLDSQLPPSDGPRALLRARLADLEVSSAPDRYTRMVALATVALLLLGCVLVLELTAGRRGHAPAARLDAPSVSLTPGLARAVTWQQVCSEPVAQPQVFAVPASLREQVFEEYGMPDAEPRAFEVDYLITPELGGAEDIRNLWPQPYSATLWNARVKDTLEQHLHEMVCSGQLDLATAQHDIATDWIAAYKKYFHTDRPLDHSGYDQ